MPESGHHVHYWKLTFVVRDMISAQRKLFSGLSQKVNQMSNKDCHFRTRSQLSFCTRKTLKTPCLVVDALLQSRLSIVCLNPNRC